LLTYVLFLTLQPLPETVALLEDIVVEYVTDLVSLLSVSVFCAMPRSNVHYL
jgi:hypothetical protein